MALPFDTDFTPTYGESERLSPLIRRVVANNPNVFTFTGTGVYLVGNRDVVISDPGPSVDEHIDSVFAALEPGERITHIFITHTHTDHTAGVPKVRARSGAPTYRFGPHSPIFAADPPDELAFDEYFTSEERNRLTSRGAPCPMNAIGKGPIVALCPIGRSLMGVGSRAATGPSKPFTRRAIRPTMCATGWSRKRRCSPATT